MVFIKDEPALISKSLFDFVKEHGQLKVEGGILGDKLLESTEIEAMSKLPPMKF